MQKIFILVVFVMFSLLARSQDSTGYTLNNINKYARHIDESLAKIGNNTAADQQSGAVQQAEHIKVYIDSIEGEMEYLPDEYYYRLSSLVSRYHTDVDEFEKLLLNEDFIGKDTFLARAFNSLQQRQTDFHNALHSAYNKALPQPVIMENKQSNKTAGEDARPVVEQHSATNEETTLNSSNVVLVEAVNPNEITTFNNLLLLDTIHQAQQQIEQWINAIHQAVNENNFGKAGVHANSISKASLKISDLTLLLKTNQKESLYILATGLKNLAETLRQLALKGTSAYEEMQECIAKISIKFNTLSTGINLVQ